jgi:tetratricopeptide (TPR) repeat protein
MGAQLPAGSGQVASRDWGEWAVQHVRALAYGAGAVVVLIAVVWLYIVSQRRKEVFAEQALSAARADAEAGNLPLAANDLSRLVDRYGGTKAGDQAVVLLNEVRLIQGGTQVQLVVSDLRSFVRGRHSPYVLASAWSLLGGALEQENKYLDAAEAYGKASASATRDFLKAQYLLDRGRTLAIAGDSVQARAAYAQVIKDYGELGQAAEARVRLGELGGSPPKPATGSADAG